MQTITQITPSGKRLQFSDETYAEVRLDGLVTIHQGQRTGSDKDWGGKVIGHLSLEQAIQIVKAALEVNEHLDDEDAAVEAMIRQWEAKQDARHDATSAHFAWD